MADGFHPQKTHDYVELTFSIGTVIHVLKAQSNGVLAGGNALVFLEEGLVQALFSSETRTDIRGGGFGCELNGFTCAGT